MPAIPSALLRPSPSPEELGAELLVSSTKAREGRKAAQPRKRSGSPSSSRSSSHGGSTASVDQPAVNHLNTSKNDEVSSAAEEEKKDEGRMSPEDKVFWRWLINDAKCAKPAAALAIVEWCAGDQEQFLKNPFEACFHIAGFGFR